MTDAAKSDGEVDDYQQACAAGIFKCLYDELCPTHKPAKCKECRDYYAEIKAHVVANASARIRAETAETIFDSIKEDKIYPDSGFSKDYIQGYNDACFEHLEEVRALASAPPGFVCVPMEPTEAMVSAGYKAFGAAMYSPQADKGWGENAIAIYQAMIAESGK